MTKEKKLPTFQILDTYNAETAKGFEVQSQYRKKITEAQGLLNALNFRYEAAVKAAVLEGKNNSTELEEISEQLEKAERDLSNKKRMQQVVQLVNKRTVTVEDVDREFKLFRNEYQNEVIKKSEKELRKAKEFYITTYLEHTSKINHFDEQARTVVNTINPNTIGVPYSVGFKTQDNIRHKCITGEDLHALKRGMKPLSLQPRKQPVQRNGVTYFEDITED